MEISNCDNQYIVVWTPIEKNSNLKEYYLGHKGGTLLKNEAIIFNSEYDAGRRTPKSTGEGYNHPQTIKFNPNNKV